jgi:hypothetical protein
LIGGIRIRSDILRSDEPFLAGTHPNDSSARGSAPWPFAGFLAGGNELIDLWEKAADCERGMAMADPDRRETLSGIRAMWLALAEVSPFLDETDLAKQIELIGRIHADIAAH